MASEKHQAVMKALDKIDSGMLQSKKFIGFMVAQLCWTVLILVAINTSQDVSTLNLMVGALGALQNMFLGTQAWHDRHVKGEKVKAMNGNVSKALNAGATADEETSEEPVPA